MTSRSEAATSIPRRIRKVKARGFARAWGCPLTKNRTPWCFRLCTPVAGQGFCGRVAPHSVTGRTDRALLNYVLRQEASFDPGTPGSVRPCTSRRLPPPPSRARR